MRDRGCGTLGASLRVGCRLYFLLCLGGFSFLRSLTRVCSMRLHNHQSPCASPLYFWEGECSRGLMLAVG